MTLTCILVKTQKKGCSQMSETLSNIHADSFPLFSLNFESSDFDLTSDVINDL